MKKILMVMTLVLASSVLCCAQVEFDWSAGGELVSNYIWRGQSLGGLSFQPDATAAIKGNFGRFEVELWANLGGAHDLVENNGKYFGLAKDNYFNPELDATLTYSIAGFKVGVTHYHYFDRSWFDMKNVPSEDLQPDENGEAASGGDEGNQLEVFAQYTISEDIPLTISWYTVVAGADGFLNDEMKVKRAFSTYIDLSYEFSLPAELSLTASVGITPWRSMYTGYEKTFVCNNLSARLEREWQLGEVATFTAFAQPMFNFTRVKDFSYGNNFMWAIGCGIWF